MKILITGGLGFIGSNLANSLIDNNDVSIVDNLSNGCLNFIKSKSKTKIYHLNYDDEIILNLIREKKFDIVYHLAALPKVQYSIEYPVETNQVNISSFVKLLNACVGNVKRFVNTSSSSVYGNTTSLPSKENLIHCPESPYALQKSVTEQYLKLFAKLYELDCVSIRPFNVFGPNQKGNSSYSCALSAWLYCIKNNKPIRFDGDGTQKRDLNYIDNVIEIYNSLGSYKDRFYGEAFNAGSGYNMSNNDILKLLQSKFEKININYSPERLNDVKETLADMSITKNILKYKEKVNFIDGFNLTCDWAFKSNDF